MPPDSELVRETRRWMRRASSDLRAADHAFTAVPPLIDDIVFHAQQAAEKALKALLTWNQIAFRKTHSLEEIGEQCLLVAPDLRAIVDRAVPLTEYEFVRVR